MMTPAMKKKVCVMMVDLVCILLVAIPCLLINLIGEPYTRGFFCSDSSLQHPYIESTVPTWALIMVSYILPGTIFFLVETSILKHLGTYTSVRLCREFYNVMGVFVFGSMVNQLLSDTAKYTIGGLRPHFLAVCNPNVSLGEITCGTRYSPVYVTSYTCMGQANTTTSGAELAERLRDMRLSFVSGHASLSAYSMWFSIVYLQRRMVMRIYRLVKPLIQVGCAMFALFTCLSRVSDFKHHPVDVLCGSFLGLAISNLTTIFLISRQDKISNRAILTTSLVNVSTSEMYTEEGVKQPRREVYTGFSKS